MKEEIEKLYNLRYENKETYFEARSIPNSPNFSVWKISWNEKGQRMSYVFCICGVTHGKNGLVDANKIAEVLNKEYGYTHINSFDI